MKRANTELQLERCVRLKTGPLIDFPDELWLEIIKKCDYPSLVRLACASSRLHALCSDVSVLYPVLAQYIHSSKDLGFCAPLASALTLGTWMFGTERLLSFGWKCTNKSFVVCELCGYFPVFGDTHAKILPSKICSICAPSPEANLVSASAVERLYRFNVDKEGLRCITTGDLDYTYSTPRYYNYTEISRGIARVYGGWDGWYADVAKREQLKREREIKKQAEEQKQVALRAARRKDIDNVLKQHTSGHTPLLENKGLMSVLEGLCDSYVQSRTVSKPFVGQVCGVFADIAKSDTTYIYKKEVPDIVCDILVDCRGKNPAEIFGILRDKMRVCYRRYMVWLAFNVNLAAYTECVLPKMGVPLFERHAIWLDAPPWLTYTDTTIDYRQPPSTAVMQRLSDCLLFRRVRILKNDAELFRHPRRVLYMKVLLDSPIFDTCPDDWMEYKARVNNSVEEYERGLLEKKMELYRKELVRLAGKRIPPSLEMSQTVTEKGIVDEFIIFVIWPQLPPWYPPVDRSIDISRPVPEGLVRIFYDSWVYECMLTRMLSGRISEYNAYVLAHLLEALAMPVFDNCTEEWRHYKQRLQRELIYRLSTPMRRLLGNSKYTCACSAPGASSCRYKACSRCCRLAGITQCRRHTST